MDKLGTERELSLEDVETLARIWGLEIAAERLPQVRDDLEFALRATRAMDEAVSRASEQGGVAFDPAWSGPSRRRGS